MIANFCNENPDRGIDNTHCFHVVKSWPQPLKKSTPKTWKRFLVESQCCWCGTRSFEDTTVPKIHGKKARRLR